MEKYTHHTLFSLNWNTVYCIKLLELYLYTSSICTLHTYICMYVCTYVGNYEVQHLKIKLKNLHVGCFAPYCALYIRMGRNYVHFALHNHVAEKINVIQ